MYNVDRKHEHFCFHADCSSCGQYLDLGKHKCIMFPPPPPPPQTDNSPPPPRLVYADIEALTDADRGFHPTLLCYRGEWQNDITTLRQQDCVPGTNVVDVFLQHMDDYAHPADMDVEEWPLVILFHNLKGFDGVFILHSLYKKCRTAEDQRTLGAKVLSFVSGALTFKDSLCFLPMPLANFPATFELTDENLAEMKKGFFPHLFNVPANQTYVGPLPALQFFDPDGMSPTKKAELVAWHAEQEQEMARTGAQYDFQAELEAYCQSDVAILQAGCEKFTKEFHRIAGFNPFVECHTIASACHRYWRKTAKLDEYPIALQPPHGWRGARINQSWVALQWLQTEQNKLPSGQTIRHVRNGGEQPVWTSKGREYVDGLNPATNTVYEFLGCLWHGCPTCAPHQRMKTYGANPDRSLNELYDATQCKLQRLQTAGFRVKVMWEHEWHRQLKTQPALQAQVEQMTSTPPLNPRNAFFGGRTGAVALYHQVAQGEKIYYVDVTSLYPWVNKTKEYPLGHPEIIFEPADQNIANYFGIALVTILPPRRLFHPVLPVRHGEKLTFPLCMACVKQEQAKEMFQRSATCHHSDQQRQLLGTWCTPELVEAEKQGYHLQHIHEVWHFPPEQRKTGLFADYVNTWLKMKQESAGWPRGCQTEEEKAQYKRDYLAQEGIQLVNVAKNPGRKQVAKLMLNSFWGKFGERSNKPQKQQVRKAAELLHLVTDAATDIQQLLIFNDDVLEVVHKQTEANDMPSNKTNIFIACFTTCHARLKLYEHLHTLQRQVLYYDTDSVIYSWKEGQERIPTGNFLGEMTDELDGDHIVEFVSGGAKNYGYKTAGGKVECKVRGFTLNVRGRAELNYDSMKAYIKQTLEQKKPADSIPVNNPHHFVRDSTHKRVKLSELTKQYRLVFDKRVLDGTHSLPFGYY